MMSVQNKLVEPKDDSNSIDNEEVKLLRDEIAHLEKATAALQEIVDALASLQDLNLFIPAALRIVARVFDAKNCAYYEHRRGELVRLRYWFFDDRVLGPEEIRGLRDDHEYADMKRLEAGFEVPDSYIGVPCRLRTHASIVDHDKAQSDDPSWDAICRSRGWHQELSVPLVVSGEADGALVIQRGYGSTYLPSEISLAERLAQQLALAMEVDRLANTSQQAAILLQRQQSVVDERANTAREIHDRLAQGYAAILMQQHAMRRLLQRSEPAPSCQKAFAEHLDIIERLSKENLAEARRTMDELRIDPFGASDFAQALKECVRKMLLESGFRVNLRIDEGLPLLRNYVETEICRVVTEALRNAHKHARAKTAIVSAKKSGAGICVSIEDDGIGFVVQDAGPSFGIRSMQERAARAGADLEILSTIGSGTTIRITVSNNSPRQVLAVEDLV